LGAHARAAEYTGPVMTWCSERLDGDIPPTFCAQWQVRNDELYVTFEGQSGGWLALGFAPNPSMLGMQQLKHEPMATLVLTPSYRT